MKYAILTFLFTYSLNIYTQENGYYYKYDFEEFITTKTTNEELYIRSIQGNIKYPKKERTAAIEGVIRIMLMNHGNGNTETVALNDISGLDEETVKVIKLSNEIFLRKSDEKYFTEILMEFDIEETKEKQRTSHIKVTGYNKPKPKYTTSNVTKDNKG